MTCIRVKAELSTLSWPFVCFVPVWSKYESTLLSVEIKSLYQQPENVCFLYCVAVEEGKVEFGFNDHYGTIMFVVTLLTIHFFMFPLMINLLPITVFSFWTAMFQTWNMIKHHLTTCDFLRNKFQSHTKYYNDGTWNRQSLTSIISRGVLYVNLPQTPAGWATLGVFTTFINPTPMKIRFLSLLTCPFVVSYVPPA